MKLQYTYLKQYILLMLIGIAGISCKKAIDPGPSKVALNEGNVYTTDGSAQSVLAGLYTRMANTNAYYNGNSSISLLMGLSADELLNPNPSSLSNGPAYTNNYTANVAPPFWTEIYREIFICNTAIKGISASSTLTGTVKQQLLAELKFVRAFNYFYATNLYGDVPLTLTDNPQINNALSRSPQAAVYAQVVKDLTEAQNDLPDNKYVNGAGTTVTDRVRPNKQVATALLARVYLYTQDWKNAETQATALITNSNYGLEANLNQVFLKTSKEAIWQLQPVNTIITNSGDGNYLIPLNDNFVTVGVLPLSANLTSAFTANDKRFSNWVGQYQVKTPTTATTYNYAFKYKVNSSNSATPTTEYPMVLRLAEQYLIRAEARAQQNNLAGAAADLNAIRQRAGLAAVTVSDQVAMLAAIERERKLELFTEWGHRWFDLKRTGRLTPVMSVITPAKGGTWSDVKQLFPIPVGDISADPNLTQTPGY